MSNLRFFFDDSGFVGSTFFGSTRNSLSCTMVRAIAFHLTPGQADLAWCTGK
jgi:hypothetical protein